MAIFIKNVISICVAELMTEQEEEETLEAVGRLLANQDPEEMEVDQQGETPRALLDREAEKAAMSRGRGSHRVALGQLPPTQDLNNNSVLAAIPRVQQFFEGEALPFVCRTLGSVVALVNAWFRVTTGAPMRAACSSHPCAEMRGTYPPGQADTQISWSIGGPVT